MLSFASFLQTLNSVRSITSGLLSRLSWSNKCLKRLLGCPKGRKSEKLHVVCASSMRGAWTGVCAMLQLQAKSSVFSKCHIRGIDPRTAAKRHIGAHPPLIADLMFPHTPAWGQQLCVVACKIANKLSTHSALRFCVTPNLSPRDLVRIWLRG